jgi:hypothetical protein
VRKKWWVSQIPFCAIIILFFSVLSFFTYKMNEHASPVSLPVSVYEVKLVKMYTKDTAPSPRHMDINMCVIWDTHMRNIQHVNSQIVRAQEPSSTPSLLPTLLTNGSPFYLPVLPIPSLPSHPMAKASLSYCHNSLQSSL